jgi:hypothetical protein
MGLAIGLPMVAVDLISRPAIVLEMKGKNAY